MKSSARIFIALVILAGFAVLGNAVIHANSTDIVRFVVFLVVTCVAARFKVKLPGLTGTMSVNLPFILVAENFKQFTLKSGVYPGCSGADERR